MLKVQGNKIYLTRGDTAFLDIILKDETGNPYTLNEGDILKFRLKENILGNTLLLEKALNQNTLELTPPDTSGLDFGLYRYEIELIKSGGEHFTVIENEPFTVGIELEVHE